MFELVDSGPQSAVIKVFGVGGGGGNAVQHMLKTKIDGVDFIAANTDAQALKNLDAPTILQMGSSITRGLGAGANPAIGREAALEDRDRITELLAGAGHGVRDRRHGRRHGYRRGACGGAHGQGDGHPDGGHRHTPLQVRTA